MCIMWPYVPTVRSSLLAPTTATAAGCWPNRSRLARKGKSHAITFALKEKHHHRYGHCLGVYFLVVRYFRELRLFCSQEEEQTDDDEESGKEITNANNSNKAEPVSVAPTEKKKIKKQKKSKKDVLKKQDVDAVRADETVAAETGMHDPTKIEASKKKKKKKKKSKKKSKKKAKKKKRNASLASSSPTEGGSEPKLEPWPALPGNSALPENVRIAFHFNRFARAYQLMSFVS